MTSERNYQIFDGDSITMGETKVTITFAFLGKLKAIEEELASKDAERKSKQAPATTTVPASSLGEDVEEDDDDSE